MYKHLYDIYVPTYYIYVNWYCYYEKQNGETLKKLKLELPFGPAIHLCEYIQRSENNYWKQYLHYHVVQSKEYGL